MNSFTGKWLIEEMELWDRDFIDLVERGHFTFESDGNGFFNFGAVSGYMDCKINKDRLEFTFEGEDEGDSASGYGHVNLLDGDKLSGRIYFHQGDDSGFTAVRDEGIQT